MRRISIFSLLTLLFLSCNNDSNKNESLTEANSPSEPEVIELTYFDCGTPVSNPFESLKSQVNTIQTPDSLIIAYNIQLDSLILNWDSLVSSENFQISEMKKALDQIEKYERHDSSMISLLRNSFCLIESNRLPADKINNTERMALFDHLLDTLKTECVNQVLDLADLSHFAETEEEQIIDQDSLLQIINDPILIEHIYAVEAQDKIIYLNSNLYLEAKDNYNTFIIENKVALEKRGLTDLKQFPSFYE